MGDEKLSLEQKVCRGEAGAQQVSIAQVCEVLRVLADLFECDEGARMQFWQSYEREARRRHVTRVVREALDAVGAKPQPRTYPPSDPED